MTEVESLNADRPAAAPTPVAPSVLVGNSKEPVRLTGVNIHGVAAEAARGGETASIWRRMAVTSDEPLFHRLVGNMTRVIERHAEQAGAPVKLDRAASVLLLIHIDNSADLWVDGAAVMLSCMIRRDLEAGAPVFTRDIGDVLGMWFPAIDIQPTDRLVYIFRDGWRFGLFFDLSEEMPLDDAQRALGHLYRSMRYSELYDMLGDEQQFQRLVRAGWFPFVELINGDFRALMETCEAGFPFDDVEAALVAKFDEKRLDLMLHRWLQKPHLAAKEAILREAVDAFRAGRPITVLKIILTEIEGILQAAHRAATGKAAKRRDLLKFATQSAEQKAGGGDTLMFPAAFGRYLEAHTFADFDPLTGSGSASSRHAVGHGAAPTDTYTQARALQAMLTLDQLAFYT